MNLLSKQLVKLIPKRNPPPDFLEWATLPHNSYDARLVASEISSALSNASPPRPATDTPKVIAEQILSNFNHNRSVQVELNQQFLPTDEYNIKFTDKDFSPNLLINLGIPAKVFTISNLSISTLTIHATTTLFATNCRIAHLRIQPHTQVKMTLRNCWVGHFYIQGPACLSECEISGGGILNIACPPPTGEQPLTGPFVLSRKIYLPIRSIPGFMHGPQAYRSLWSKLNALGNHQVAGIIRRKEECLERESDSRSNRFFSYLYQYASDFGSSAIRPLVWLFLLFVANSALVFFTNGADKAQDDAFYQAGWRPVLAQTDINGRLARALVLALDPITNPLGVFATRTLLVAHYWPLAVWLVFCGLISAVLIALFIFALRRRFKIQ